MAGIYFHIPFCKQACLYCDFHFSTNWKYKEDMLNAMHKELENRSAELDSPLLESIYFGGGTPSILSADEIQKLVDHCFALYQPSSSMEITLEANPDDLTENKVKALSKTDINRFSIGVQSFFEEDLKWMNRAHNHQEADTCIKRAQDHGFENLNIDLIYGYPLLTQQKFLSNIKKVIQLEIPHVSAYSMTVESRTQLGKNVKKGIDKPMNDEQSIEHFEMLQENLRNAGFHHYEISNWALPGLEARHNSNYWKGKPYLGIGPSAHSFDGKKSRKWNIRSNSRYIEDILEKGQAYEEEILTAKDKINELIMTQLRTSWGLSLQEIEALSNSRVREIIEKDAHAFIESQEIIMENEVLFLTPEGKLMADFIAAELFLEDEIEFYS